MNIAIIGTGNIGSSLATAWSARHTIMLGVRDTSNFKGMHLLELPNVSCMQTDRAVAQADAVLISIPPVAAAQVVASLGGLHDKVIVDATNSVFKKPEPHATVYHLLVASGATEVVKCFNSTGYENIRNPRYGDDAADMFMAGDSARAKDVARALALECGFGACIDFGGADKVELLEQLALAWINLAMMQGNGRDIAFRLMRR